MQNVHGALVVVLPESTTIYPGCLAVWIPKNFLHNQEGKSLIPFKEPPGDASFDSCGVAQREPSNQKLWALNDNAVFSTNDPS